MKKNIIPADNSDNSGLSNMLNPQMLQLFSGLMSGKNGHSPQTTQPPVEVRNAKEETKEQDKARTVLSDDMILIYNKQLVDIIKNHDRISRKLERQMTSDK